MKKISLSLVIMLLISLVFLCGCTQQGNAIVMTIKELENDQIMNISEDYTTFIISFKTLDEGDNVALTGTISDILYDSENDTSYILFTGDYNFSIFDYSTINFEGDLTNSFSSGDEIKISLTVKRVTIPIELGAFNITYDIELFEEQWIDSDYFKENMLTANPFKSIPQNLIKKI